MYLHRTQRRKNGKDHEYWSIVESWRLANGRVVQRHVLYLGEINSVQERAWARSACRGQAPTSSRSSISHGRRSE